MKLFTVVVAILPFAGLTVAEDKLPPKVVRVVGTAEVKVVPDRAVVELGVERQNANAGAAKRSADEAARMILASLQARGVDEKDIQTTFLSLQPEVNYHKGVKTTYFAAQQTMSVTVRDLSKLDAVLESLIKSGGNRIDSIRYETSDLRKYRDEARELAVKAAREKAQALARAAGQEIGKAQSIEEVPEPDYQILIGYLSNFSRSETPEKSKAGPTMSPGQKSISASITVSFDLN